MLMSKDDAALEMEKEKERKVPVVVPAHMSGCGAGTLLLLVAVVAVGELCMPSSLPVPELGSLPLLQLERISDLQPYS
eukprot:COSAG05_NODE_10069_length_584_cov_1.612371_1_plen_78_part_00